MADGFVGLFLVPGAGGLAIPVLSNNGSILLEEELQMMGPRLTSVAKLSLGVGTSVQISNNGVIDYCSVERKREPIHAINFVTFVSKPQDGDTITLGDGSAPRQYTFKNTLATTDQIKIGGNVNETFTNFVRTLNLTGSVGVEYFTGQTENAHYDAFSQSTKLAQLKVTVAGATGNNYTLSTSSGGRIAVNSATSFGGNNTPSGSTYETVGMFPVYQSGVAGWRSTSNNSAVIMIPDMPFSSTGMSWKFRVKYYNADGQQATNSGGTPQALETSTVVFDGREGLPEYAEVFDLRVSNASNPEGIPSGSDPANLPPGGIARLEWTPMDKLSTTLTSHMCADGTTRTITETMLAQLQEYVVYIFVCSGTTSPTNEWPYPLSDTNGDWYLVTRTKDSWAEVQCPINKRIAFWVGWGTGTTAEDSDASKADSLTYSKIV